MPLMVQRDDPRADDIRSLLATHLAFAHGVTPAEFSFALDVEELADPSVSFFSAREDGRLLGIAALKKLDDEHAELKSMHARADARNRGVGRALLERIVEHATAQGYRRISLETGTTVDFAPARTLYASAGFIPCDAFADYRPSPYNMFMTRRL